MRRESQGWHTRIPCALDVPGEPGRPLIARVTDVTELDIRAS